MRHVVSWRLAFQRVRNSYSSPGWFSAQSGPFTYAAIKYAIHLQYFLKTDKKSEFEKAQWDILVATEHLPKESVIMAMLNLLTITLEFPLKQAYSFSGLPFSYVFEGLLAILGIFRSFLARRCDMCSQLYVHCSGFAWVTFVVSVAHLVQPSVDTELHLSSLLQNRKVPEIARVILFCSMWLLHLRCHRIQIKLLSEDIFVR